MRVLDLFSGIGGFSLAAHWHGWETVAFVEKEPFCYKVLNKNFPGVPIYDDIFTFDIEALVDAIECTLTATDKEAVDQMAKRKDH